MKIKAVWGFVGNATLLGAESTSVKAGQEFEDVDDEYGHALIGKGLVVELEADGKPKAVKPTGNKSAKPNENK